MSDLRSGHRDLTGGAVPWIERSGCPNSLVNFGASAVYELHFVDEQHLEVTVIADSGYPAGTVNRFDIEMTEIGIDQYMVTWIEPATGNTITHVEDFGLGIAYTNITDMESRQFWRLRGTIRPVP